VDTAIDRSAGRAHDGHALHRFIDLDDELGLGRAGARLLQISNEAKPKTLNLPSRLRRLCCPHDAA
jgi:hypothetical protein